MKRTITVLTLLAMTVCSGWFIGTLIISSTQEGFARHVLMLIGGAAVFAPFFWYAFVKNPPKRTTIDSDTETERP